ncbi:hypothetical protein [Cohnella yongneupensis]|uniref:Uncharacterized protein n=1 Tax=Cohnella yongneupensis TaxID=425006 RepID=A0ABW0QUC6_9BACL
MFPFRSKKNQPIKNIAAIESMKVELANEEFPEGPYGSAMPMAAYGKSTPWLVGQQSPNAFDYENKELHAGLERDYPGEDD